MKLLDSFRLMLSMFTALPVRQVAWSEKNQKNALLLLPTVGFLMGLMLYLYCVLARALNFSPLLIGAGLTVLPIALTGGVHLDGFIDVVDALSSHAAPERKRAILKDPHVGAFAVIYAGAYLICYFALASELPANGLSAILLAGNAILARVMGGLGVILIPPASESGLSALFLHAANREQSIGVLAIFAILVGTFLIVLQPVLGLIMLLLSAALFLAVRNMAQTEFCGMSGDIAGFLIATAELLLLACYVIVGKAVLI